MSLSRWVEGFLNADVQLPRTDTEPTATPGAQRLRFFDFGQAEKLAEETARFALATLGSSDLEMVDISYRHDLIMPNLQRARPKLENGK
jgi:hypothetical protein